jgi:hypothetical protein
VQTQFHECSKLVREHSNHYYWSIWLIFMNLLNQFMSLLIWLDMWHISSSWWWTFASSSFMNLAINFINLFALYSFRILNFSTSHLLDSHSLPSRCLWVPYCFVYLEASSLDTSRKHGKKRIAIVFPLRFFWPPWSAVSKRLHICFFGLPTKISRIWGLLIYC